MWGDAVLIDEPQQRTLVGHDRVVNDAVLLRNLDALQPIRKALRDIFLDKTFLTDARGETLHRHRPLNDMRQHHACNHFVVRREVSLGNSVIRKQNLFSMRDHNVSLTTCRGDLSLRIPNSLGWRSLPCVVHSMKATWTTISGCTQCARMRGRPLPFVNGGFGISSLSRRERRSINILVSKPVPIFPANAKSSPSKYPTSNAPSPTRLPCGSVNPPTTSSCDASHFIFSQYGERRCSYVDVRSFAMKPSHPSRHARSQGFSPVTSGTLARGAPNENLLSNSRRCSSGRCMTGRSSSQRMSNMW